MHDSFHAVVTEIINPVTRSVPKVVPPVEINSMRDMEAFTTWVLISCRAAWMCEPREDPDVLDASNWREDLPVSS